MNYNFFYEKMTGDWIIQSTNYSSNKKTNFIEMLNNDVNYKLILNKNLYNKLWLSYLKMYSPRSKPILYCIEFTNSNKIVQRQYLSILIERNKNIIFLKFNHKLKFLNKFIIETHSQKYLSIISKHHNITIIEKIYFLSNNLKVIKTIIKKHNQYVLASFSSEIRIS